MIRPYKLVLTLCATLVVVLVAATPASAACPPFICYLDLVQGAAICNQSVYQVTGPDRIALSPDHDRCPANGFVARVEATLPAGCSGLEVLVEYGDPVQGHTVDLGDSEGNDGFGGDRGELPAGQNAEVHVLDEVLSVYSAADNPVDVETLATNHLALTDGALKLVVEDQFVSWGQPHTALSTPDIERLFFLPDDPEEPANRTLHLGLNRVVSRTDRNGCGVRHVLMFTR